MGAGYSLFRRRRDGVLAPRWTIVLRLPDGKRREVTAFTDKQASKQKAAELVRAFERKEVGLHDPFAVARKTALQVHLEEFCSSIENGTMRRRRQGGRPTEDWIATVRARLTKLFLWLGASRIEHLNVAAAEDVLSEQLRRGWSTKTRDHHAALLRQFGAWLVEDQRWASNPFHRLRTLSDQTTKTFRRHALTVVELGALVAAAEQRALQEYATSNPMARPATLEAKRYQGWERGVLYQVAAYTGLRRGEVTKLQWADLRLGGEPSIEVRAETAKNRQRARIELPRWLGALLEQVRTARALQMDAMPPPRDRVFAASYRHLTERLKLDALWAELGTVGDRGRVYTAAGKVLDFHALRGTLATLAAECGMPAKHLQQLMRHSDLRLTMDVYAQVRSTAMRTEVERLPAPVAPGQEGNPPPVPPSGSPKAAGDCLNSETGAKRRETGT
jgi:integrase